MPQAPDHADEQAGRQRAEFFLQPGLGKTAPAKLLGDGPAEKEVDQQDDRQPRQTTPMSRLAGNAPSFSCSRGWAKPRQPNSSAMGPPKKMLISRMIGSTA